MGLSPLQQRVARSFFALPESAGFALADGGALVVQRLPVATPIGPARSPEGLAGDKLVLSGRARRRDLVDVYRLHEL